MHRKLTPLRVIQKLSSCCRLLRNNLSHLFSRTEIPGKRHRCVLVLLTAEMRSAMDLLVDDALRERAGIEPANVFVFALGKGSLSHIRGHDILEKTSKLCGAEKPNLHKHIATMSQILHLKNNELDQLAQFMGHDIRIHREYYRNAVEFRLFVCYLEPVVLRKQCWISDV